jgi:AraC-like DNA-binding protein
MSLMRTRVNNRVHQLGNPPSDKLSFGLPVKGMLDWLGRPVANSSVLPFNSAAGIDGVSDGSFDALTISLDKDFLSEVSDTYQLPVPDYLLASHSREVIRPSESVPIIADTLACLIADDTMALGKEQEETVAVELLQAALAKYHIVDKSTPAIRARALMASLDFIEQHQFDAITVGDICRATGSAERTLRRAFLERFGIAPKAYLQHIRLCRARDQLSIFSTDNTIADVANNLDFWHMGNFARDYRRLFGELPSETWRRRSGAADHSSTTRP